MPYVFGDRCGGVGAIGIAAVESGFFSIELGPVMVRSSGLVTADLARSSVVEPLQRVLKSAANWPLREGAFSTEYAPQFQSQVPRYFAFPVKLWSHHVSVKDDPQSARSADVKAHVIPAVLAAALSVQVLFTSFASAQNQAGANATKFGIAVVDVGYIFKNHQRFKTTMEGMKSEMQGIEKSLKSKREGIAQKEAERNEYNLGTPEYKGLDEEVARQKADFNVEMTQLRKDFLEREAKVYHQTYLEVDETVRYYAERQNIGLVLRFNGEKPDPNRRDDVLRSINKPVVFQNNIDITPDVLSLLNRNTREIARPDSKQIPR